MINPTTKQETKAKTKGIMQTLSDKMEVGMAKIKGEDYADLDVAILKATAHEDVIPKEKHVRTLQLATGKVSARPQVVYVISTLAKRMDPGDKPGWLTTLKCLIVFHRLMREGDSSFQEEMIRYADKTGTHRLVRLDSFADHTTKATWDYSAWIRVYSVYLDERLSVFRITHFDPAQESAREGADSQFKACSGAALLEHLPPLQKLLSRVLTCVPEGAAATNAVSIYACTLVLKELKGVYKAVSEAVLNLVDKFFEMERGEASKALELYKENAALNDKLNAFFASIQNNSDLRASVQFPTLQALPSDFITTMEDYIREAPKLADPNAPTGGRRVGGNPSDTTRVSTMAAHGGTTSSVILPGLQLTPPPPSMVSPKPVQPASPVAVVPPPPVFAAPPPPPPPAPEVDLLDFGFASIDPVPAAAPAASGSSNPHLQAQQDFFGQSNSSFGSQPQQQQQQPPQQQQQYGAPQYGAPGPQAYGAPQQQQQQQQQPYGYGAPQQGYAPAPGPGGFAPQPLPYAAMPTGFVPQQQQQQPLPAGYAPQQTGGYAPQQTGGYAPQQPGGYAPQQQQQQQQQQAGYAPQQTGYAAQQTGYAQPAAYGGLPQVQQQQTAAMPAGYSLKPLPTSLDTLDLWGRPAAPPPPGAMVGGAARPPAAAAAPAAWSGL